MNAKDAEKLTKKAQRDKINEEKREEQQRKETLLSNQRWFEQNKERWFIEDVKPKVEEAAKKTERSAYIAHQGDSLIHEKIAFLKTKGFDATWDTHLWRPSDESCEQETTSITVRW